MRHRFAVFAATALLLGSAAGGLAQTYTGTITGVVKDEQGGVLPGATVTAAGKAGSKTSASDAAGNYRFPALDPGIYTVTAELSGFRVGTQDKVNVTVGSTMNVDFTLKVGGLETSVSVLGSSPVVDTAASSTQTQISQDLLYSAPITRTAINVFNIAPGINSNSAYGGESSSANALLIDGVDTRDPEGGTAWTFYNYNMVQEIQIQGLGAPAEYGGFTGAVVNTVTKSGGNRTTGLFDIIGTRSAWSTTNITKDITDRNPALKDAAKTKKFVDFTTQVGGPIKKDKLFYFVSAQRFQLDVDPSGPVTLRHELSPRFNFKINWQPGANDSFMYHLQYDGYNIIGRAGVPALVATDALTNREDAPEFVWLGQWRHIFNSKTFAEVKYTGWWGYYDLNPEVNKPGHLNENGEYSVSQGWFYYADRDRHQANAAVSHYAEKFGRHELKFGAEIEHSKVRNRYGYVDNISYYDYGGAPYLAYSYGYDVSATNNRQSLFAQDSWKIGSRITINPGVRLDLIQGNNPTVGRAYSTKNASPRLGFAIDILGDFSTVLKGAYSRYFESAEAQIYERAVPGVLPRITYDVSVPGKRIEIDRFVTPIYKMDPDIKHPRVDEGYLAVERALGSSMRLTVTGIYRENKNFINSVIPSARWTPVTVANPLASIPKPPPNVQTPLTLYRWANRTASETDFLITNPAGFVYRDPSGNAIGTADPFRKYRAIMVVLNKRLTNRWTAQVSYVGSKATGTVDNTSGSQTSSRQFESPNSALVFTDGRLTNDRTHEFKILGSYTIPIIEVSASTFFHAISGRNYTPFNQVSRSTLGLGPNQSSAYRRPFLEPRGSERNPAEKVLDLSFEKIIPLSGRDKLGVYVQILNVGNAGTITSTQNRVPSLSIAGVPTPVLYGAPGTIIAPRQVNLGARWSF